MRANCQMMLHRCNIFCPEDNQSLITPLKHPEKNGTKLRLYYKAGYFLFSHIYSIICNALGHNLKKVIKIENMILKVPQREARICLTKIQLEIDPTLKINHKTSSETKIEQKSSRPNSNQFMKGPLSNLNLIQP